MKYDYQVQAKAGLELLAKRLEKLAEAAGKIEHTGAKFFRSDADAVRAQLAQARPFAEPELAKGAERHMIRTGLGILVHNMKAASGTVSALGKQGLADEFRVEAEFIEQHILPALEDQIPMALSLVAAGSQ